MTSHHKICRSWSSRAGAALAMLLCLLAPLQATPPRSLAVEDVLFAVNDSHLFLLRRVTDNLETHMTALTDLVLVAKRLDSGREDAIWPVRRVLAAGDPFTIDQADRVKELPLPGQVDPFALLGEHHARPLLDSAARPAIDANLQNWFSNRVFALGKWEGQPEFEIALPALAAQIAASLKATRAAVPLYEGGYDPLLEAGFTDLPKCEVSRIYLTRPVDTAARSFVKLRCLDPDNAVWTWLYVAVPPVEQPSKGAND